jgi:glyoxylase-like metal-dependent hydrolase (beta-lactamase superfamily II)
MVLYEPELELLISADALWENGFGIVFPELEGGSGFDAVGATLDRLAALRVRAVIPGPRSGVRRFFRRARTRAAPPRCAGRRPEPACPPLPRR